jgi:DNA polymerase-3 subunit chi
VGDVLFYHLTQTPLEATLPNLLIRSLERGWRVAVQGCDPARLNWLDQRLWALGDDSFLPHGVQGGPHDADQPVLLCVESPMINTPDCMMLIDGAPIEPAHLTTLSRTCILFDGYDEAAVNTARGQWKQVTGAGAKAQYWSEESGRWEKKAEA